MRVLAVFGTRPEAIKMCPLVLQLKKTPNIDCCVCLTGQHREMLDQVMDIFGLCADFDLNIMRPNQSLSDITIGVIKKLGDVIEKEKPDLILVHGDTSTSFAAALVSFYYRVPIGHVEAGLRTYDMGSPYPEEFNRQTVDLVTDLYFAPTELAKENLLREGKEESKIFVTGNTVIDALKITVKEEYKNEIISWMEGYRTILLTAHRRESLGDPMRNMFRALKRIVEDFPDVKVIYPVHRNPKVRDAAEEILGNVDRVRLMEPMDVYDFHNLMYRSYLVLTDSGGIQEEAPAFGKPVLVMRDTTERPEGIAAGTLRLVGTNEDNIYYETRKLLIDMAEYEMMSKAINPYGDGHASERIAQAIVEYFRTIVSFDIGADIFKRRCRGDN